MKRDLYNKIINSIGNIGFMSDKIEELCKCHSGVDQSTLQSIYAQDMQRKVKKLYHKVTHPATVSEYYQEYVGSVQSGEPPGILVKMAYGIGFSPAMLAKIILEYHLNQEESSGSVSRSQLNKYLRDTSLIQDRDLSYEVYLCLVDDTVYGPFADSIKHSIGHEYEFHLRHLLTEKEITFQDEDVLRRRGYDKTPDIKLDIPIAVDGNVINWIESKASFGDEESHRQYLKDQFWSYWNRFGPGLVIYWFGFISDLDEHREKGIYITDTFPSNITFMDPLVNNTLG